MSRDEQSAESVARPLPRWTHVRNQARPLKRSRNCRNGSRHALRGAETLSRDFATIKLWLPRINGPWSGRSGAAAGKLDSVSSFQKPERSPGSAMPIGHLRCARPVGPTVRMLSAVSRLAVGASRLPVGASRLPVGASRLPVGASRLPVGASRLAVGASRLPVAVSRLSTKVSRLPTKYEAWRGGRESGSRQRAGPEGLRESPEPARGGGGPGQSRAGVRPCVLVKFDLSDFSARFVALPGMSVCLATGFERRPGISGHLP
jgi:hypothetical protein